MSHITLYKGANSYFNTPSAVKNNDVRLRKGQQTIVYNKPVRLIAGNAVVGKRESQGPIGKYFRNVKDDVKLGEKSFERAEILMLDEAIRLSMSDSAELGFPAQMLIAGDLLNQLTSSSYVARNLTIPYLGVYSACSTITESLLIGAGMIDSGYFDTVACATSSHFATAERQFRYPLEYGCQRPPYSQWTVTAAACSVISAFGDGPKIVCSTIGKAIDFGQNDLSNMGSAMAPAACVSLTALFNDTNTRVDDYDLILTGDLGKLGSDILRDLMRERGYELGQRYIDCGSLMYDLNQNCYQGGSGAGCSASVLNEFVLRKMRNGEYGRVAIFATGALMSTQSCYQGDTIPCISHGIVLER